MKRLVISILSVIYFGLQLTQAQNNGYLGRKLSFSIGIHSQVFGKIYPTSIDTNKLYQDQWTFMNTKWSLGLNYVLRRRGELSIGYSKQESYYLLDQVYIYRGFQVGGSYRIFEHPSGSLAPIGKYISMGLQYHQSQYEPLDKSISKQTMQTLGITSGIGVQRAIGKRFLFDLNYQIWLTPEFFKSNPKPGFGFYHAPKDYLNDLTKSSISSINLKLGFLVF